MLINSKHFQPCIKFLLICQLTGRAFGLEALAESRSFDAGYSGVMPFGYGSTAGLRSVNSFGNNYAGYGYNGGFTFPAMPSQNYNNHLLSGGTGLSGYGMSYAGNPYRGYDGGLSTQIYGRSYGGGYDESGIAGSAYGDVGYNRNTYGGSRYNGGLAGSTGYTDSRFGLTGLGYGGAGFSGLQRYAEFVPNPMLNEGEILRNYNLPNNFAAMGGLTGIGAFKAGYNGYSGRQGGFADYNGYGLPPFK